MWQVASSLATRGGSPSGGPASLVYGADINDKCIYITTITTEEGSPWKATAGADPRYIQTSLQEWWLHLQLISWKEILRSLLFS
jgi:hypothetical protein